MGQPPTKEAKWTKIPDGVKLIFKPLKAAAMAMAKGACGDYVVSNPIAHLNGLTAIILDRE